MDKDDVWHIRQNDTNRFEEYITLREEMLELFRFCRQLLYWTLVLIVGGVAWQIGNSKQQLSNSTFALVLLAATFLSFSVYFSYMRHIYNIGGFLAVFWESRHNERGLKWHRFSRSFWEYWPKSNKTKKRFIHGMMNVSTAWIYTIASIASVALLWVTNLGGESFLVPSIICILEAVSFFVLMYIMGRNMRSMEDTWLFISENKQVQEDIHDRYEPK